MNNTKCYRELAEYFTKKSSLEDALPSSWSTNPLDILFPVPIMLVPHSLCGDLLILEDPAQMSSLLWNSPSRIFSVSHFLIYINHSTFKPLIKYYDYVTTYILWTLQRHGLCLPPVYSSASQSAQKLCDSETMSQWIHLNKSWEFRGERRGRKLDHHRLHSLNKAHHVSLSQPHPHILGLLLFQDTRNNYSFFFLNPSLNYEYTLYSHRSQNSNILWKPNTQPSYSVAYISK